MQARIKTSTVHTYRRKSPNHNREFLSTVAAAELSPLATSDIQLQFDEFYKKTMHIMDTIYPLKQITIACNDPNCITPEIKAMLRNKN